MTYAEAAITVLKLRRRPLSTREITDLALEHGLIHPIGKTPVATMALALYLLVRDTADSPLVKVATPGLTNHTPAQSAREAVS
jgi:hypothetical protein